MPVAINTLCLLLIALVVNNLTGRQYLHVRSRAIRQTASSAACRSAKLDLVTTDPVSKVMTSHIPVLDGDDRLCGIVTRTELIAVLNRALLTAGGYRARSM